jgi:arylsulfatase B
MPVRSHERQIPPQHKTHQTQNTTCLIALARHYSTLQPSESIFLMESGVPASPNILFLLVDDLGWNDVSVHGSPQIQTSHIDALAKRGVLMDQYYVNPVCSPTRASLLSGRSIIHHGVYAPYGAGDDASGLNLTYTLLPQLLKQKFGYHTMMVGKW